MAKENPQLKRIRSEVKKRRNAVTAKINRIERNTGVDLEGTKQDPRRSLQVVDRYNTKQLRTYLAELNAFMSRSIGFRAGLHGTPISNAAWNKYKAVEKAYNAKANAIMDQIGDIVIEPASDKSAPITIRIRDEQWLPKHRRALGEVVHRPYSEIIRPDPSKIKSEEALDKIRKSLEKKLSSKFQPEELAKGRDQLKQMLASIRGTNEMMEKVDKLNDYQFNILWNYTSFATTLGRIVDSEKSPAFKGISDEAKNTLVENETKDAEEYISWAGKLTQPTGKTKKPTRRSKR